MCKSVISRLILIVNSQENNLHHQVGIFLRHLGLPSEPTRTPQMTRRASLHPPARHSCGLIESILVPAWLCRHLHGCLFLRPLRCLPHRSQGFSVGLCRLFTAFWTALRTPQNAPNDPEGYTLKIFPAFALPSAPFANLFCRALYTFYGL